MPATTRPSSLLVPQSPISLPLDQPSLGNLPFDLTEMLFLWAHFGLSVIESQDSAALWWPQRVAQHSTFASRISKDTQPRSSKTCFASAHEPDVGYQDAYNSVLAFEKLPVEREGER